MWHMLCMITVNKPLRMWHINDNCKTLQMWLISNMEQEVKNTFMKMYYNRQVMRLEHRLACSDEQK
jgi:hypothetical protein